MGKAPNTNGQWCLLISVRQACPFPRRFRSPTQGLPQLLNQSQEARSNCKGESIIIFFFFSFLMFVPAQNPRRATPFTYAPTPSSPLLLYHGTAFNGKCFAIAFDCGCL